MDPADAEEPDTALHLHRAADWSTCLRPPMDYHRSQSTSLAPPMRPFKGGPVRRNGGHRPGMLRKRSSQLSTKSSNAERWFEDSNRNVQDGSRPSMVDDEPPFYLADHPVSDIRSTACVADSGFSSPRQDTTLPDPLPIQSTMRQLNISENSSDDYRSVIDDLTVENQELRHRLAKYERLHCSHLQNEKLFEVTFHGLPPEKRVELEQALKEFAASISRSSPETGTSSDSARQQTSSGDGPVNASRVRREDSGYGSLSMSGRASTTRSPRSQRRPAPRPLQPPDRRQLPPPRASTTVREVKDPQETTDQKKRLVVRRLEQLFTGKISPGSTAALPLQHPEGSEAAVAADRTASEVAADGRRTEGVREARILPLGRELSGDSLEAAHDVGPLSSSSGGPSPPSANESPEQRPTRPLDLDLRRSHQASDNLSYIRHLGMSTPTIDHAINAEPTEGWVYLNLLSNMAQLHTLNVTPTFIRDAVSELSTKLQLSEDGRKIRWKGGNQGSKLSGESSSDPDPASTDSADADEGSVSASGRKRKLSRRNSSSAQAVVRDPAAGDENDLRRSSDSSIEAGAVRKGGYTSAWSTSRDRFLYQPLFFRKESTDNDSGSLYNSSRGAPFRAVDAKADAGSSLQLPADAHQSAHHEDVGGTGPVIFYKRARFYTDLSGESARRWRRGSAAPRYSAPTADVIGCGDSPESPSSPDLVSRSRRLSWDTPVGTSDAQSLANPEQSGATSPMSFDFSCPSTTSEPPDPSDIPAVPQFEVSGLAGILPADHFLVNVRTHRNARHKAASSHGKDARPQDPRRQILSAIESMLGRKGRTRRASNDSDGALSTTWTNLPPSALPPPSCVLQSTSTSSAGSSTRSSSPSPSDSSESPDDSSEYRSRPAQQPSLLRAKSSLDTSGSPDQTGDVSKSSSSIDLMAAARLPPPSLLAAALAQTSQQREDDARVSKPGVLKSVAPRSSFPTLSSSHMRAREGRGEDEEGNEGEDGVTGSNNRKRRRPRTAGVEGGSSDESSPTDEQGRTKISKISATNR